MHGLEENSKLVEFAKNNGFDASEGSDLKKVTNNKYDLIVAFDVLEHLDNFELKSLFFEINDKLKNNGFFLARFPNGDSFAGLQYQNGDITHKTFIGSNKALYFSSTIGARAISIKGQETAIDFKNFPLCLIKVIIIIFRYITNLFLNFILFNGRKIYYLSANLVMLIKINK